MSYTQKLQVPHMLPPPSPWLTPRTVITPRGTEIRPSLVQEDVKHDSSAPTTAQYLQVCAELEITRQQLEEERQFTRKLKDLLMTQHAEHSQEVADLNSAKEQLRAEVLDLIQDLETTLSTRPSRSPSQDGGDRIECVKRSLLLQPMDDEGEASSQPSPAAFAISPATSRSSQSTRSTPRSAEDESFHIPSWTQITRNIQSKKPLSMDVADDGSTVGSQLTRCASSLSSGSTRSSLAETSSS
eukprot:TRINITY_DN50503_c0_g1_i1.p1 TRINITY_DN50503_c0_g1~~TRINITY_DN50503_c0_g1_i1.p1  ORF type:complete len:254 (+),score=40.71 TRINITY_DN50503_c0_g1_i1:37-762(+)